MGELERRLGTGGRDERKRRLEQKATGELLRYKQVNDFLFPSRLFPHLSTRPGPQRDELGRQSLPKATLVNYVAQTFCSTTVASSPCATGQAGNMHRPLNRISCGVVVN